VFRGRTFADHRAQADYADADSPCKHGSRRTIACSARSRSPTAPVYYRATPTRADPRGVRSHATGRRAAATGASDGALVEDQNGYYADGDQHVHVLGHLHPALRSDVDLRPAASSTAWWRAATSAFRTAIRAPTSTRLLAACCKIFFRFRSGARGWRAGRRLQCVSTRARIRSARARGRRAATFRPLLQVTDIDNVLSTRDLGFSNIGPRRTAFDLGSEPPTPTATPWHSGASIANLWPRVIARE
jgi:hypothetical protein